MVKKREGYHTASVQLPDELWDDLCRAAASDPAIGGSANRMLELILAKHFDRALPPKKKPGPKPPRPPRKRSEKP